MKKHAPATVRNRGPLLEALRPLLHGAVLEIASGSGEHAAYFAEHLPTLTWHPTDVDFEALASIDAWCKDLPNVAPARELDASTWPWPVLAADAIFCANMIHIAPPAAAEGLLVGASRVLSPGSALVLYGPFREAGVHTADSNARFDADLQSRNPEWGVRDLDEVVDRAGQLGLFHEKTIPMPANNRVVILRAT